MDLQLNKPEPIQINKLPILFKRGNDVEATIKSLQEGKTVLIDEFYNNGLALLNDLHTFLKKQYPGDSFNEQREYRSEYQKLSNLILIEVKENKLAVKKGPWIGWLEILYPEVADFYLTFPQIQGLNSAWQWHRNGINIPVLRNKIHPYYGVYFPTRFEHLVLLDNWLKRYDGPKKTAIDVGIGSGVLSMQLVKHGFQKSFGTDINPNAIIGLKEFMGDTKLSRKIELDYGNLFGKWDKPTELILFNPPWLPASHDLGRLDDAIYYNDNLFPEFFEEAKKRLLPEGKVVLLFSNLAQITNVSKEHPIEKELADGARFELDKCIKKGVKEASEKTKRNQNWRSSEEVELWVLKLKN